MDVSIPHKNNKEKKCKNKNSKEKILYLRTALQTGPSLGCYYIDVFLNKAVRVP